MSTNTRAFLYRGVSRARYTHEGRRLCPKQAGSFAYVFHIGEVVDSKSGRVLRIGDGARIGSTAANAVLRHQVDPVARFPTSGVSTTPLFERAAYYATRGYSGQPGYVLTIDRTRLDTLAVREYVVSQAQS